MHSLKTIGTLTLGLAGLMLNAHADDYKYSIEGQLSRYLYEEPGFMSLRGNKIGVAGRVEAPLKSEAVLLIEGRLAYGEVDYVSLQSGSDTGEPDMIGELRLITGQRLVLGTFQAMPYVGYGFRTLINDSEGMVTTTGHIGYLRISQYQYLPIGIEISTPNSGATLTLEYDHLLIGNQTSYLPGETVENRQRKGNGYRASLMIKHGSWAIGPYIQSWNIAESERVICRGGGYLCVEPANTTQEVGIRLRYTLGQ